MSVEHRVEDSRAVLEFIQVVGVRENNLASVDVEIPKRAFTGVSGSGKSSLLFDTIADIAPLPRLLFSRAGGPSVGYAGAFSFNMPAGRCPECEGTGEVVDIGLGYPGVDRRAGALSGALTGQRMAAGFRLKDRGRTPAGALPVVNARTNNLRDITLDIPAGVLTAICGVAGAGKSSLMNGAFRFQRPDAMVIDQSLPHPDRRSTYITYRGVAGHVRAEFARAGKASPACSAPTHPVPARRARAWRRPHPPGGAGGHRSHVPDLHWKPVQRRRRNIGCARTISDVLEMTVSEDREFFAANRRIAPVLAAPGDVCLDNSRLGRPLTSLSGGERQA